jgi:hypothetical protein
MSGFVNPLARRQKPGYPEAIARIKLMTRQCLNLPEDVVVSVTELACRDPGCPDIETVVAILRAEAKPQTVRFHKPIPDVEFADLQMALSADPPNKDGQPMHFEVSLGLRRGWWR